MVVYGKKKYPVQKFNTDLFNGRFVENPASFNV